MKIVDIKTKSDDELNQELLNLAKEQFNLRFQQSGGQMENTAQVRKVRRTIARIKTVLTERAANINVATAAKKTAAKKAASKKTS